MFLDFITGQMTNKLDGRADSFRPESYCRADERKQVTSNKESVILWTSFGRDMEMRRAWLFIAKCIDKPFRMLVAFVAKVSFSLFVIAVLL